MTQRTDMQLVGRDGELWLYASRDRKTGVLYDSLRKIESEPQPLQVFFKWGNFDIEEEKPPLEESVALALQNYRDGAIDADDLVAFLLPTRLEESKLDAGSVTEELSDEDSG